MRAFKYAECDYAEVIKVHANSGPVTGSSPNSAQSRYSPGRLKSIDKMNHRHMLATTVVFYNYCRKHKSLGGKTPAMAAGLTDYVWTA